MMKGMRVTDKYTLIMDLIAFSNQLVPSWGYWPIITSKTAWDKASRRGVGIRPHQQRQAV
jgi:hypothetical protein